MPINVRSINISTQQKKKKKKKKRERKKKKRKERNESVDATFTHLEHHAQSGHSTWSALDIFNTLRTFAHEPIGEQEIK